MYENEDAALTRVMVEVTGLKIASVKSLITGFKS